MYPAAIADSLRASGYDVVAVQEEEVLRELSDEALFAAAQAMGRAIVTENVKDYVPLDARAHAQNEPHHGLVFTTNRSFPRHREAFIGAMARGLDDFLRHQPGTSPPGLIHWLRQVPGVQE